MNKHLITVIAVLGFLAAACVITVAILATDTEMFEPVRGTDCINVDWQENHPFSPDKDHSGLYCPTN